ncbi:MAG: DUF4209 domain-containing protein, partial [Leptospiraceae bacterium]|nr:DUF4209 domain-containing protein [Leptospiraceae bacterium]
TTLAQKHFLISYLDAMERDPTKDFLLVMYVKHMYLDFFKNQNNETKWKDRLDSLKDLDLTLSPIFEAVWLFGKWKIGKNYELGIKSAQKFEEMERIAYKKDWFWILTCSLETAIYIYKMLGYDEQLKLASKRITSYLKDKKETLPPRTILELSRLFNNIINVAEREDIEYVYTTLIEFSERMLENKNFIFQRNFLSEAIKIAKFLKLKDDKKQLHEKLLQSWINEAQEKGKVSKLVKYFILQQALDYSVKIGYREMTQQLKKELAGIDFSDELIEITIPEQEREQLEKIVKEHYEMLGERIREYINRIGNLPSTQILLNICMNGSIIRINLEETKEFVQKLMREHPLQNIFSIILLASEKTVRLESIEDKEKFQLNQQLNFGVLETIWIVTQIFRELQYRNILTLSSVADFLSRCNLSKNSFELILHGAKHHFQGDYVASVSILTPLIESILFDYLRAVGADVSSYESKIIEQRELGGLLNLREVKDNFGENFQCFLKLLLVEADSINFRNRFAHGNVAIEEFNESTSSVTLFIILKICAKLLIK